MCEVLDSFERFIGRTVESAHEAGEHVVLRFTNGTLARFYHDQDCCENVGLENTIGTLGSLIGKTIQSISKSDDEPADQAGRSYDDAYAWSIFTIVATDGTTVVMQWLGESNGYYGVDVYVSEEPTP